MEFDEDRNFKIQKYASNRSSFNVFICRWCLDVYGCDKKGNMYFWNGVILTSVFICCRVVTMPWYWYRVYDVYGTAAYIRTGNIKYVLFISCAVLDVLNLLWSYKLLRGVHKTLKLKTDANKNITVQKAE